MLALKYLLVILGIGLFGSSGALVVYDVYLSSQLRRLLGRRRDKTPGDAAGELAGAPLSEGARDDSNAELPRPLRPIRWGLAQRLAAAGVLPLLLTYSIALVPDGFAGVRVSQIWGARPGTLYPGVHLITPLVDSVELYDTREQVYTTAASHFPKTENEVLTVQAREGLNIGLAVSVRYRLDPQRLGYIHANLPRAVGDEVVAPTVATIYRQLAPNYITREIFATRREELRLAAETEIKQKQVKIAELEAEAQKSRDVKQAEAQAQVRVLQAKAESDSMQYTLPLKQKQIEQSKLEAQARKEATLQNAEAAAQAKVIDSKAELERQKNLSDAEANRIRVTAAADAERMKFEASVLKQNPMLIQKIIAERLSDKLQIMMVPMDGKNFFANDVMHSAFSGVTSGNNSASSDDSADSDGSVPAPTVSAQKR